MKSEETISLYCPNCKKTFEYDEDIESDSYKCLSCGCVLTEAEVKELFQKQGMEYAQKGLGKILDKTFGKKKNGKYTINM